MIDMSETTLAKVDQLNAEDLTTGPRTFTITQVRRLASDDQPIAITLDGWPSDRPYKPNLSMRRILKAAWGNDGETYVGKRLTLFCDASVRFGGMDVGGLRISHMSDLPKGRQFKSALTVTRGSKKVYVVDPLPDAPAPQQPPEPTEAQVAAQTDLGVLERMLKVSGPDRCAQIEARIEELREQS